ncbi:MAG: hypothetical protein KatS3mg110_0223 [Pirellulaceae bacterium]|nr:MAG: hypothetical protein KatS3mg110_0223 [Pirellulaceae bacterium]
MSPTRVADDALLVDKERSRAVAEFGVDTHLKRYAVGGTQRVGGVEQQGNGQVLLRDTGVAQQTTCGPRIVRVHGKYFGIELPNVSQPAAQLRELAVADRSRVTVEKHQNHMLAATKVAQPNRLPIQDRQFEVRCRLTDGSRVDRLPVPVG